MGLTTEKESRNYAKTDKQKLATMKEKFGKDGRISEVEKYCDEHGIKTDFFCWP